MLRAGLAFWFDALLLVLRQQRGAVVADPPGELPGLLPRHELPAMLQDVLGGAPQVGPRSSQSTLVARLQEVNHQVHRHLQLLLHLVQLAIHPVASWGRRLRDAGVTFGAALYRLQVL